MKISNIVKLSHSILKSNLNKSDIALDLTLGNGYDTLFLSDIVKKVYSFDIQEIAINNSKLLLKNKNNITIILDSSENFLNYCKNPTCALFNLGYLPNGNKNITTTHITTINTLDKLLNVNSIKIIVIVVYPGHNEGMLESIKLNKYLYNIMNFNVFKITQHIDNDKKPYIFLLKKIY